MKRFAAFVFLCATVSGQCARSEPCYRRDDSVAALGDYAECLAGEIRTLESLQSYIVEEMLSRDELRRKMMGILENELTISVYNGSVDQSRCEQGRLVAAICSASTIVSENGKEHIYTTMRAMKPELPPFPGINPFPFELSLLACSSVILICQGRQ